MANEQVPGPQSFGELARLKGWLENPQKMLRLLAGTAGAHAGPLHRESVETHLEEDDVVSLVRLLAHVALLSRQAKSDAEAATLTNFFRQRVQNLSLDVEVEMERALGQVSSLPAADSPLPARLAEKLALRLAQGDYQRGKVSPTGLHALLGRMSGELGTLRRALGVPAADDYALLLEEEFWAELPEPERRRVLTGPDAWCVPPRAVRSAVEELDDQVDAARNVLDHYAACAHHPSDAARSRAAQGMGELADLYAHFDGALLESAIQHAGSQLALESRADMQLLFSNAFARLSRQAADRRGFRALRQALEQLEALERVQPPRAKELRASVAVEEHLQQYIREALRAPAAARELVELLRQAPQAAADTLCAEFDARAQRGEQERLVELARGVGPGGLQCLRDKLRSAPPAAAVGVAGLLSRLEPAALVELLPALLGRWGREVHDTLVRSLAAGGAPDRGRLLLGLLDHLHPVTLSAALDEIGLSGDRETAPRLLRLAGGTLPQSSEPFLRLKAIEALGRLREPLAAPLLRQLVEAKRVWRWAEPREIRIAAAQALLKIDPDWARKSLRRSGLQEQELAVAPLDPEPASPWVRQRRYPRIPLVSKMPALASTLRGQWWLTASVLSLGGGLAESPGSFPPGTEVQLQLQSGLRPIRATAVVRDPRPPLLGFEIVGISLEERSRLRRLLLPHWQQMAQAAPVGA